MRTTTAFALATVLFVTQGCYQYSVSFPTNGAAATDPQSRVVWSFLWGATDANVEPGNCPSNATYKVSVTRNFLEEALTVVTLGIVSPATVEWQCAKFPPTGM